MAKVDTRQVKKNLKVFSQRLKSNLQTAFAMTGIELENQAKRSAPWTDQTGNARNSIKSTTEVHSGGIRTALAIGMSYGVYLELSNGGRYRTIWPTVEGGRPLLAGNIKNVGLAI